MYKILAFAGSNSSTSINLKLVKYTLSYFKDYKSTVLDLNDYEMPVFSVDREKKGIPQQAYDFLKEIADCDIILLSLAEHNRTFTAAFKNLFDWCSRIDINIFQNKPMLLMSASPGKKGGASVMEAALKHFPEFGGNIVAHFSLPAFYKNLKENDIQDPDLKAKHEEAILKLKDAINQSAS